VLIRRIARPLLATTFLTGGLDQLRHPGAKAPKAEKLDIPSKPGMAKLHISSTEQAVRVNGAVQVVGGTLLVLNRFPRLAALTLAASLVPTTAAGHRFWEEDDKAAKSVQQAHFFKNLSLLGGLLIASVDTAGKESLVRKTKRVSRSSKRKAEKAAAKAASRAHKRQSKAADKLHDVLPV
jgi:putative oxidoreductase